MAEKDKRDVANSPFIINEQKVAFLIVRAFTRATHWLDKQLTVTHMELLTHHTTWLGDSDCSPRVAVPTNGWDTPLWLCHLLTQSCMSVHTNNSAQNK